MGKVNNYDGMVVFLSFMMVVMSILTAIMTYQYAECYEQSKVDCAGPTIPGYDNPLYKPELTCHAHEKCDSVVGQK